MKNKYSATGPDFKNPPAMWYIYNLKVVLRVLYENLQNYVLLSFGRRNQSTSELKN